MIDLTPDQFRALGYRAIDQIADQLAATADAPVRQNVPADQRAAFMQQPLPEQGRDPDALLQRVFDEVLPYPMGNNSPRFFAWVNSPPAPLGVLAELLAAAHGASAAGGDHAATYIEHGVLNWLKAIFGFPADAGGILTSGGSVANLIPLAAMRQKMLSGSARADGLAGHRLVVYTSTQGHSCIQKAVELLGIGSANLRKIPTDSQFRVDVDALRAQIAADRASGLQPACVVASAGTVNTGAIDPLDALADLCADQGLWFHVDGAYGGFGILSEQAAPLFKGIERADSIAVDPHKWLYMPIECGSALVRDAALLRDTFSLVPPYLRDDRVLPWFSEFGIQQTRGFKALKLWLVMQQIGLSGYRDLITRDVALAQALQGKIVARPDFALVAAGPLSVTCFLYAPQGVPDLAGLNRALVEIVQSEGGAFLTGTELDGQYALRACIVNFRTTEMDLDVLLDIIAAAGQRVLSKSPIN